MNYYALGAGAVAALALVGWIASLEIRVRIYRNKMIAAKLAETNAEIVNDVGGLSDAERTKQATIAAERYSKP